MLFIYIHGFNSSPASFKAQCFSQFLARQHGHDVFIAPQLADSPLAAMTQLSELIEEKQIHQDISLIGSSLGGFYATSLAHQYGLKATLINPAVNPQIRLLDYLGKNKNYHTGVEYDLTHEHIKQLDTIDIASIETVGKLQVLLQTGDKVLDYRLAQSKYRACQLIIEQGGDHSFVHFDSHCSAIYQFLKS